MDWLFRLPPNISTFGADIDQMFWVITWITGIVFIGVEVTLLVFIVKYRHREGRKATYIEGNKRLEYIWTGATAVIVIALALFSRGLWFEIKDPARFPDPGLELRIVAKQFEWSVTYPGADGRLGSGDDYTVRNQLHVPTNVPVHIALESEDVIHSFYVPQLRLKQDAVPGMTIPMWFEAIQAGEYVIGCAELCGLGHYRMRGALTVHEAADFTRWDQERQVAAAGGDAGTVAASPAPAPPEPSPVAAAGAAAAHSH
jgi:cytochrome c oxidase subunit 2